MRARLFFALAALLFTASSHASTISFSGTNVHDDDLVIFHYTVQNQGLVTVATTSWVAGGFIPILSLFDVNGVFQYLSDGYTNNSDATLSWVSDASVDYTVVLTEYNNYPIGNLSDGFSQDGQGDFTTALSGFPGPFRDPGGAQLTGDWAVNFTSADPTLQVSVPEPGTGGLMCVGVLLVVCRLRRGARPRNQLI